VELTRLVELINEERRRRGAKGRPQSLRAASVFVGISHVALSDIVRGQVQPSPETCVKIAKYLGMSAALMLQLVGHLPPASVGAGDLSPAQEEAARLIEELPNEAWRYAALDQLRRLKQLGQEGAGAYVVGGEAEQETQESEATTRGGPEPV
jgi:transcriptional regulator with XRE-family HTH domain